MVRLELEGVSREQVLLIIRGRGSKVGRRQVDRHTPGPLEEGHVRTSRSSKMLLSARLER